MQLTIEDGMVHNGFIDPSGYYLSSWPPWILPDRSAKLRLTVSALNKHH